MRCGGIAGVAHPLVSTPSADWVNWLTRPVGGSARDYPWIAGIRVGFPEFTRFASRCFLRGPLFVS